MNFSGETLIAAPQAKVWEALNDPSVLKASIPGCDALEAKGDSGFTATVRQKIGPVTATFEGEVTIADPDPPVSYRLMGKGSGGIAGFAKGSALVTLSEENGGTRLHYEAEAELGGKIAQLGGRLIQGVATKIAAEFFAEFGRQVTGEAATVAIAEPKRKPSPIRPAAAAAAAQEQAMMQGGPGWRAMAQAGWGVAIFLGALLLLERLQALH